MDGRFLQRISKILVTYYHDLEPPLKKSGYRPVVSSFIEASTEPNTFQQILFTKEPSVRSVIVLAIYQRDKNTEL